MGEGSLVRALALLSDLYEKALGYPFGLGPLDDEVVIDQIDYAGRHTTAALFRLRPDVAALRPEDRGDVLDLLFEEHCRLDDSFEPNILLLFAWNELSQALERRRCPEVEAALGHLDVVAFLLDPDHYHRSIADASPEERVQLASELECVELMVEEARALAMEDRCIP